jgi:hypothetical protein
METLISEQRSEIHRLEDLVYRLMHRNRVSQNMEVAIPDNVNKARRISLTQQSPTRRAHDRKPSNGSYKRRSRSK